MRTKPSVKTAASAAGVRGARSIKLSQMIDSLEYKIPN
jgi:hypothetical protein